MGQNPMQNTAVVHPDGTGTLTLGDQEPAHVTAGSVEEARRELLRLVIDHARSVDEPVEVVARDPNAEHHLNVAPDGTVQPITNPAPLPPLASMAEGTQQPATHPATTRREAHRRSKTQQPTVMTRREARERSFLADARMSAPQPTGWKAVLARVGIKAAPTTREVERWEDERAISQHWPGPRTIAVLNGKGGAGKTPATALLSAMFARAGGSGVLAWDNNVTRGTLGWRTESGLHESTVLDLIPHTDQLLTFDARAADLAAFVHHQTIDKYDVLRSNPLLLSTEQKLTPDQLDAVHGVAAKYYRLIIMDSGNDEGDALWLRMIDHADQLVVATTTRPDHAEAGRLLLNALAQRDEHSARLADQAVVVVSQADREEADAASIAQGYDALARSVVTIPYDPAMRQQWLRVDNLAAATRRAYLRAAAEVAAGLWALPKLGPPESAASRYRSSR
ncbi:MAG: AAA family ATPase [Dermatophilaceae bacterium]